MNRAFAAVERVTGVDRAGQLTAYLVAVGHGGTHWLMATMYILLPFVRQDLGLSYAEIGGVITAMNVAAFATNIGAGPLVDMTARRATLLAVALAGCAVALLSIGLVPSLIGLTIGVMIIGGANNFWHPAAFSYLAKRLPDNRGFALSIHGLGANTGDALGPLAAGSLMVWIGWQGAAVANALPMFALALMILVLMSATKTHGKRPRSIYAPTPRHGRHGQAACRTHAVSYGYPTMTQNGIPFFCRCIWPTSWGSRA